MRVSLRLLFLLILCDLIFQSTVAQDVSVELRDLPRPYDAPLHFDHLTIDDGLSQQAIYSIIQDRNGFMWFGTEDGLNRYDGYSVKKYQNDPRDPGSLGIGLLFAIQEDDDGMLWIGRWNDGLSRFDPDSESFTHYSHDDTDPNSLNSSNVRSINHDQRSGLWIGTDVGLDRFDPQTGTFVHILPVPDQIDEFGYDIRAILEDRSGLLWLGTSTGVVRYDRSTGGIKRFLLDPEDLTPQGANLVTSLYEDKRGTLWAGAHGLHRFNPDIEAFEDPFLDPDEHLSTAFNRVRAIAEDGTGVLWVGDQGSGLYRFNRDSGTLKRYIHDPADPNSLNSNFVLSVYPDRQGILWVGTRAGGGVNRNDRTTRLLTIYPVGSSNSNSIQGGSPRSMYLDRDDVLWISAGRDVLNQYDRQRDVYNYYRHDEADPESLLSGSGSKVLRDRQGQLWVGIGGNQGGLSLLHEKTGRFSHYRHDPNDSTSIASNNVLTIYEDRDGILWVGAGGLNRFDQASGTFRRYTHASGDSTSLSEDVVVLIYEDLSGHLWVGTWGGGLNRFDRENGTFTRYRYDEFDSQTLNNDIVLGIYERPEEPGVLWISSFGGLDRLDVQTGYFRHYTSQNSDLPTNTVPCVLGDDEGYLWLSTHAGLVRFNPDAEQFRVFRTEDGLQMLEFDGYSCHKGFNGELFFGGAGGVNAVRPGEITENPHPPEVALTGLRLFNEPVVPGSDAPLQTSITGAESITLTHDQNDVTLEYVGLHFRHPERNEYAYMLEGYDEGWREVGAERWASYTNLPSGDYTFRVKASNSDGVWNEEGRSLAITILPPWWQTRGMFLVYGFLFLVGIYGVDRIQRKRVIAKEREKTRERELAQAKEIEEAYTRLKATQQQLIQQEKMASLGQLTSGIAHEIKNPLNFVNNFADLNAELLQELEQNPESKIKDVLETIYAAKINAQQIKKHGQRADDIVKSMMQHAGVEGERYEVAINPLVEEFVNMTYSSLQSQRPGLDVAIEKNLDVSTGSLTMIPQQIGRVLQNILSNAIEAVYEKKQSFDGAYEPKVYVSTSRRNGQVEIRIADNGMGIPDQVRDRVFEPFFTTKPAGSGTGLGLSLSYDVVTQGHGGMLTVESTEGEGAAFIIALPESGD